MPALGKRYLYVLSPLLMLLMASYAIGQTLTGEASVDKPLEQKLMELGVKLVGIVGVTLAGPYIAGLFITAPQPVKMAIASLISGGVGTLLGEFTIFPLGAESSGTIGVALGVVGQYLLNRRSGSLPMQPQTPDMIQDTEIAKQRAIARAQVPPPGPPTEPTEPAT